MKAQKLQINEDLIGKYINRCLYTDSMPVGKIVGIKGKTKVLIQPVIASANKTKMEIIPGGFTGHCVNNRDQRYDFIETGEVYEERLSNTKLKDYSWRVQDAPSKFHDYNF
jgi:hypothetical protein